jgi:glycosyltransferase involved in cell wall biosynthesis
MKNYYARAGIPVVEEFPDVMRQADVYACDNSSTLYEFASTGRPVVVLNAPWYRRTVEHGLRFWSAANVGVQCDDPADLSSAILRALMDDQPHQVAREAALDVAYAYRSGAAQRAAEELEQWLSA